jgi:hypothetical protein
MSNAQSRGRERQEKVLAAMFQASEGTTTLCPYEEIVVHAWKMFPAEFGLRGFTELYPDSSDLHKPLYGPLKRLGFVRSQNKKFGLTERGLSEARRIVGQGGRSNKATRVERHQRDEISRLRDKAAVGLVAAGKQDELLDTDFYDFYSVTVRTKPGDFAGRMKTVDEALEAGMASEDPSLDQVQVALFLATREELKRRFDELIRAQTAPRGKSRR